LLRATVLQEGFSARPGHVFTREPGGFFDVIQIIDELELRVRRSYWGGFAQDTVARTPR
jgi:hypothetical protein